MKIAILAAALLGLSSIAAAGDTTCVKIGTGTTCYGDQGFTSYRELGSAVVGDDGSQWTRLGDGFYGHDGERYKPLNEIPLNGDYRARPLGRFNEE